jgi:cyanophycinase
MWRLIALAAALTASSPAAAQDAPRSSGPGNGSLLLVGGGPLTGDIVDIGDRLAGGAASRWVVILTNGEGSDADSIPYARGRRYVTMDTRNRAVADTEEFVRPLKDATGVWFVGGHQWHSIAAYKDTRTERELQGVLDRGGVLSGTSAGATVMGSYLVRGDPSQNRNILMSPGNETAFGFMTNAAIDQHLLRWGRSSELVRLTSVRPELLGIGIDESTAILVQQNTLTVIGRSVVEITDGGNHQGKPYFWLSAGDRFDLATWTRLAAK